MLTIDTRSYDQNVGRLHSAVQSAGLRTVKSMALAAKDGLLAALAKAIDKPTPFTLSSSGYQASNGTLAGGSVSADFTIKQIQANYLWDIFYGGTRVPGDAGTTDTRMFVPTFDNPASKNVYGGVPDGYSKKLSQAADASKAKKKWNQKHTAFAKLTVRGKTTWGFWLFPARDHYKTTVTVNVHGKQVQKVKTLWSNVGEPVLLLESRLQTHYKQLINLDNIFEAARKKGADGFDRRLADELSKRGLT